MGYHANKVRPTGTSESISEADKSPTKLAAEGAIWNQKIQKKFNDMSKFHLSGR